MGKHCDFGHIIEPSKQIDVRDFLSVEYDKTILELDLEVAPNTFSHLISPGAYRFEMKLAAANVSPITKIFEINLTGNWYFDEKKMFSDGIGIKEIRQDSISRGLFYNLFHNR